VAEPAAGHTGADARARRSLQVTLAAVVAGVLLAAVGAGRPWARVSTAVDLPGLGRARLGGAELTGNDLAPLGGLALLGLVMTTWPLAPSFPVALLLVAVAGVVEGPAFAATFATRQRWSPADLRGQIFTTAASLKVGAFAVGAALAGPAVERVGVGGILVAAGAIHVLAALLGMAAGAGPASPTRPRG